MLSVHTGGNGWYTPDLTKDETGVLTQLVDGFATNMHDVLGDADVKRMRPNSDLGEVRWFFENYHFPSFVYEYPKDIAPMDHLEREAARNHTLSVIKSYWKTLQAKAFVRGVVVDQEGNPNNRCNTPPSANIAQRVYLECFRVRGFCTDASSPRNHRLKDSCGRFC